VPSGQARHRDERRSGDVQDALAWLLIEDEGDGQSGEEELMNWYFDEIKVHFLTMVKAQLDQQMNAIVSNTARSCWKLDRRD
jgi:hypothetical protein